MSRNKYPEETVQKILDTAHDLFLKQGYEQTSMQSIVEALGLSKGAIYHHFKSKEELLIRVLERDYEQHQRTLEETLHEPGLTGLQKIRRLVYVSLTSPSQREQVRIALPVYQNPQIAVREIYQLIEYSTPHLCRLIEEGNADGSLSVQYPYETAETLQLLFTLILHPQFISFTRGEWLRRVLFFRELCAKLGMPVIDDELLAIFEEYFDAISSKPN